MFLFKNLPCYYTSQNLCQKERKKFVSFNSQLSYTMIRHLDDCMNSINMSKEKRVKLCG